MICKNCGSHLPDGAEFCPGCGNFLTDEPSGKSVTKKRKSHSVHTGWDLHALSKNKTYMIVAAAGAGVVALIILIVVISNLTATNALKSALDSKDADRVNTVYAQAYGKESKLKKYDKVIKDTIDTISKDLNAHDFDSQAVQDSADAVYDYVETQWGTLLYDDNNISPSISASNAAAWSDLEALMRSKADYCQGIYAMETSKNYQDAISNFSQVLESDSAFENAKTKLGESVDAYIGDTLIQVEAYVADGDINGGLEVLNTAKSYLDECGVNSDEISQKINETLVTYADSYAQKAEACFNEKDVDGAIGNMEVAMELQPDNADYKTKYDTYQQYLPFALYLEENVLYEDETGDIYGGVEFDTTQKTNNNKTMTHSMRWYNNKDEDDGSSWNVHYNLEGKYNTASCIIFLEDYAKNSEGVGYFKAYGDGKLLYTSPKMTAGVLPEEISFDISGVQKLTLSFFGSESTGCGISDLTAQKAFPTE